MSASIGSTMGVATVAVAASEVGSKVLPGSGKRIIESDLPALRCGGRGRARMGMRMLAEPQMALESARVVIWRAFPSSERCPLLAKVCSGDGERRSSGASSMPARSVTGGVIDGARMQREYNSLMAIFIARLSSD